MQASRRRHVLRLRRGTGGLPPLGSRLAAPLDSGEVPHTSIVTCAHSEASLARALPTRPRHLQYPRPAQGPRAGDPLRWMRGLLHGPTGGAAAAGPVLPRARVPVERGKFQSVQQPVRHRSREAKRHVRLEAAGAGGRLAVLQ
eukprot:766638-Hanusia_phi.AAC.2